MQRNINFELQSAMVTVNLKKIIRLIKQKRVKNRAIAKCSNKRGSFSLTRMKHTSKYIGLNVLQQSNNGEMVAPL